MSIAAHSLSESPIGAQVPAGSKKPLATPPANRRLVAKSDTVAAPEPR